MDTLNPDILHVGRSIEIDRGIVVDVPVVPAITWLHFVTGILGTAAIDGAACAVTKTVEHLQDPQDFILIACCPVDL